jgi:hypothetical protein
LVQASSEIDRHWKSPCQERLSKAPAPTRLARNCRTGGASAAGARLRAKLGMGTATEAAQTETK